MFCIMIPINVFLSLIFTRLGTQQTLADDDTRYSGKLGDRSQDSYILSGKIEQQVCYYFTKFYSPYMY